MTKHIAYVKDAQELCQVRPMQGYNCQNGRENKMKRLLLMAHGANVPDMMVAHQYLILYNGDTRLSLPHDKASENQFTSVSK